MASRQLTFMAHRPKLAKIQHDDDDDDDKGNPDQTNEFWHAFQTPCLGEQNSR